MQENNLLTLFVTGLLTGGLTCMAVQGGLLATTIAQHEQARLQRKSSKKNSIVPISLFLFAKLGAYTVLGALLGWVGALFTPSIVVSAILQAAIGVFIIGTALNLLNVHPVFRYFVIQPPHFITRFLRRKSKSSSGFAPVTLGAFTVLIPCPSTQAVMALAVASGSPVLGALMLFAFTLGTSPIFFALGFFAARLSSLLHGAFVKIAAIVILLLGLVTLDGALALSNSPVTMQGIGRAVYCTVGYCETSRLFTSTANAQIPVTDTTIVISKDGYTPKNLSVKAGSNVTLRLQNKDGGGSCAQSFTIPKLNIQKLVKEGNTDTISFKAPKEKGEFAFMCSMGMYPGTIRVI